MIAALLLVLTSACDRDAIRDLSFACGADCRLFYAKRANEAAWIDCAGGATPAGARLAEVLARADRDGLSGSDYAVDALDGPAREVALTRVISRYAADFRFGRTAPAPDDPAIGAALDALARGDDALGVLQTIAPKGERFASLWSALRSETLSSTVAARVAINLERARSPVTPHHAGMRRIEVNVPSFTAEIMHDGEETTSMRVIVGRRDRPTPLFGARIERVVFNPYWSVPRRNAVEDILPLARKNARYFTDKHMRVLAGDQLVDPESIDWKSLVGLPYRFRQDPGPWNALGRVKLEAPNPHGVLLHDTSAPELFARSERMFSSGCVRLEDPSGLALALLSDQGWTKEAFDAAIASNRTRTVKLDRPAELVIGYWTAEVRAGRVTLYDDVYGLDRRLEEAIARRAPAIDLAAAMACDLGV